MLGLLLDLMFWALFLPPIPFLSFTVHFQPFFGYFRWKINKIPQLYKNHIILLWSKHRSDVQLSPGTSWTNLHNVWLATCNTDSMKTQIIRKSGSWWAFVKWWPEFRWAKRTQEERTGVTIKTCIYFTFWKFMYSSRELHAELRQ